MSRQATLPLLFALSPALQPGPEAALARRLRRAALRREPIALGTAAVPYEPVTGRGEENPLRQILLREEGLEIAITAGSPRILRELELLVELERRHSVAVRIIVPAAGEDPETRMRVVRGLAAEGIATSLLLSPAAPGSRTGEETFRFLLEGALEAGALDVAIDARSLRCGERAPLLAAFQRLRLEYGFPRGTAGRG
jgi:DNA repair photolyase